MARKCTSVQPARVVLAGLAAMLCTALSTALSAGESPDQAVEAAYGLKLTQVAATPDPKDDAQLANAMVSDAKAGAGEPALAGAVCRRALKLALVDPNGALAAEAIAKLLIERKWDTAARAWQALVEAADAMINQRNLGPDDLLLSPCREWRFQWVMALIAERDAAAATRQLDQLARDAKILKQKFLLDRVKLLQARVQFQKGTFEAVKTALAQVKPEDPKTHLVMGETLLAQEGDWVAAAPYLIKANNPQWNLILKMHVERKAANRSPADDLLPGFSGAVEPPPPETPLDLSGMAIGAPAPAAPTTAPAAATPADLIAAADFLIAAAAPGKRPAPAGRLALLREAAGLLAQAQSLAAPGLTGAQKLKVIARQREIDRDAAKASTDLAAAFEKVAQFNWIELSTGNLKADWKLCPGIANWKILDDGTLRLDNGDAATTLHSARSEIHDFVFEGEIQTLDDAHPSLLFRYRPGPLMWRMELEPNKFWWYYTRFLLEGEEICHGRCTFQPKQWNRIRVAMAGNSYRISINGQVVTEGDMKTPPEEGTGGHPGFGIFNGHSLLLRNLRIRELK